MNLSQSSRPFRWVLGLLSLWPMLMVLMIFWPAPSWVPRWQLGYDLLWAPATLAGLIVLYFLFRLWHIETIGTGSKLLWTVRFLLTGFIALPIFWYFFIWKAEVYAEYELEDYEEDIDKIGLPHDNNEEGPDSL